MVPWLHGCMAMWLYGFVAAWLCVCVAIWPHNKEQLWIQGLLQYLLWSVGIVSVSWLGPCRGIVVFRLFLSKIKEKGYTKRMKVEPDVCRKPVELHKLWWTKFTKDVDWGSMSLGAKKSHFRSWLLKKFSVDPKLESMDPGPGCKRWRQNEAKWHGFWLSDREFEELLKSIFEDYAIQIA